MEHPPFEFVVGERVICDGVVRVIWSVMPTDVRDEQGRMIPLIHFKPLERI